MSTSRCAREPGRGGIVGKSFATQKLLSAISRVAPLSSTVLIAGPSGTGKELVARSLHESSNRAEKLFIPVDCASITGELMASQLFGHVKGAFTSADQGSLGCFRAADRGTIFLDEIGELPLALQSKLLRVIQERCVVPVGSHVPIPIDVRILAATNRDLRQEVRAGRFREDLYYRLSVLTIQTVPLRERPEDILDLAPEILAELESQGHPRQQLTPGAMEILQAYDWPGNVRELKNVLEQAAIQTVTDSITECDILEVLSLAGRGKVDLEYPGENFSPERVVSEFSPGPEFRLPVAVELTDDQWPSLADMERRLIHSTLERTYYNKSAAARLLDISRQALLRKMARFGIVDHDTPSN